MPTGVGAVRTCKRVVTLPTGVGSVRACKRVEAGRSLETEPPPVWAGRWSCPHRAGRSPARWSDKLGRRGGVARTER